MHHLTVEDDRYTIGGQGSSDLFLGLEFEDALRAVGIHHVIDFSAFIFTER